MEVAGTDGQAKKGRAVVEISAGEGDPITITSRLEKPMRKKPPFLRWLFTDYHATGPNTNTSVPIARQLNRGRGSVSYPVSEKGRNQEPLQTMDFLVGL